MIEGPEPCACEASDLETKNNGSLLGSFYSDLGVQPLPSFCSLPYDSSPAQRDWPWGSMVDRHREVSRRLLRGETEYALVQQCGLRGWSADLGFQ